MSRPGIFAVMAVVTMVVLVGAVGLTVTQPTFATTDPVEAMASPDRLKEHVRTLSTEHVPRDYAHPEGLDATAAYIRGELAEVGGRLDEQVFTIEGKQYRNVIARFGPETDERIVVGAHYDTCRPLPGADDNASGVAGMLELARALADEDLPMMVEVVAYTLEEPPFFRTEHMGSAHHASSLARGQVRATLVLETIGMYTDEPGSQRMPSPVLKPLYPSVGNFIAVVGRMGEGALVRKVKASMVSQSEVPVHSMSAPSAIPGVDFSDHLNYWKRDHPALMITDTAFYRNERYHTPDDTWDTLDYARMARVVDGVIVAVRDLARD